MVPLPDIGSVVGCASRKRPMSTLVIAALAFAAGFLTCAAGAIALIAWSFSDRRVRDARVKPARQKIA